MKFVADDKLSCCDTLRLYGCEYIYLHVNKCPTNYNCFLKGIGNLIESHINRQIIIGVDINVDVESDDHRCILCKEFT